MRTASIVTLVVLAISTWACGQVSVADLRCEYRAEPLGIDVERPRLAWVIESSGRGVVQRAYQVLVAGSREELAKDRGDLWDSQKVFSAQSAQVEYAGRALAARQECFWKVRVWDGQGRASEWSKPARWSMGFLGSKAWKAGWITTANGPGEGLPYFRKTFEVRGAIRRATLYVTAHGVYEARINGRRVGADYFTPGWTEYEKRMYYNTYDVTALLREGDNVVGAVVGDGWWGLHHGGRGRLGLRAQLHVEYACGAEQVIGTDRTWKATAGGPVLASDIYQGEAYDARREMPGWDAAGFDDRAWTAATAQGEKTDVTARVRAAVRGEGLSIRAANEVFGDPAYGTPKRLRVEYTLGGRAAAREAKEGETLEIPAGGGPLAIVSAQYGPAAGGHGKAPTMEGYPGDPVRKTQEIEAKAMTQPKPGVWVFDMGQNFSGWARLKVAGPAGAAVTMRFAEMLNPDGTIYTRNLRGARCTDRYVLKGGGVEEWEPRFTFHGFRYVELTGCPTPPTKASVTGVVLHSDCGLTSEWECSNAMLTQLQRNIVWGQRSNYFEVPTDCPQRDERMGWSGDAQVFIGTGAYNMGVGAFFTSWLTTYADTQAPDGAFGDISPKRGGVSPGWGDAGVVCPWALYRMYGDTRLLRRMWGPMTRWIDYLETHSRDCLRPAHGYGDWLSVGADTPKDVIATAWFAHSTDLMARMARAIDKPADAARFEALSARIKAAFNKAYVAPDGRVKGDTQTAYLMALGFDLLPADKRPPALARLVRLIDDRKGHLSTGFLGVNLLLPVLTEAGRSDLAYRLIQNEDYPSWGYPVKHGATTIWERWDGWTEARGFQDPGMNSFNHYAYGACGEWMFRTMAGIDTDSPGFDRLLIRPRPGGGVTWVKASYRSLHGLIAVAWKLDGDTLRLDVTIPANTSATVHVPTSDPASVTEGDKPTRAGNIPGLTSLPAEPGAALFHVGSGHYTFRARR